MISIVPKQDIRKKRPVQKYLFKYVQFIFNKICLLK